MVAMALASVLNAEAGVQCWNNPQKAGILYTNSFKDPVHLHNSEGTCSRTITLEADNLTTCYGLASLSFCLQTTLQAPINVM